MDRLLFGHTRGAFSGAMRDEPGLRALALHGGNATDVAKAMGKARMQTQRWMRRFGIDPETYRGSR